MSWLTTTAPRQPVFERVSTIFERVQANVRTRTGQAEFAFGIPPLDAATHGLPKGKVTIIASRVSEGKTSLGLQVATHLAVSGKTVAFVSLEDDRESIVERLFCQTTRTDHAHLMMGQPEWERHPEILPVFDRLKLVVLDNFGYNFHELEAVMQTLDPKPDTVIVDYVQMVDQRERESEYEAVSRFVRHAKVFAETHKIGMVLLSQINRAGARDGRPELHHLANCGRLEQVANLVLLMFTPHYYEAESFDYDAGSGQGMQTCPSDYVELMVAKNKTGPRGIVVPLRFVGSQYRFEPWGEDERTRIHRSDFAARITGDTEPAVFHDDGGDAAN